MGRVLLAMVLLLTFLTPMTPPVEAQPGPVLATPRCAGCVQHLKVERHWRSFDAPDTLVTQVGESWLHFDETGQFVRSFGIAYDSVGRILTETRIENGVATVHDHITGAVETYAVNTADTSPRLLNEHVNRFRQQFAVARTEQGWVLSRRQHVPQDLGDTVLVREWGAVELDEEIHVDGQGVITAVDRYAVNSDGQRLLVSAYRLLVYEEEWNPKGEFGGTIR